MNQSISILSLIKKLFIVIVRTIKKFSRDRCFMVANGLSYKTIFGIIPVFAVFFGIFSVFPSFSVYKDRVMSFLVKYLVPESAENALTFFDSFLKNTKTLSVLGTIILIYISLDLFLTLDNQVNIIWNTVKKRTLVSKILLYWAFLSITPIVVIGYFYYSGIIQTFLTPLKISIVKDFYIYLISFIFLEVFFFFLYYFIPNRKIDLSKALIVSAISTLLWLLLRYFFGALSVLFINNWIIYGSIATILIFFFWLYLDWIILLIGMELLCVWQNKLYIGHYKEVKNFYLFDLCFIMLIIKEFYNDFLSGGKGLSIGEISEKLRYNRNDLEEIFTLLIKQNILLENTDKIRLYHLRKDVEKINLSDIEHIINQKVFYRSIAPSQDFRKLYDILFNYYYKRKDNYNIKKLLDKK